MLLSVAEMGEEQHVVAKYEYQAADHQELDMKKNERLVLLDDTKHWWKVCDAIDFCTDTCAAFQVRNSAGQAGFVPSNYVKRVKPSFLNSLKNTLGRRKGSMAKEALNNSLTRNGDLGGGCNERLDTVTCCEQASARYDYNAQQHDELGLEKGMRVEVLRKSSDGWWYGRREDKPSESGWFPSNYVQLQESRATVEETPNYDDPSNSCGGSSGSRADCLETVLTLYPFSSDNPEELNFSKDELLEVLDKPPQDPDWWRVRNKNGAVGLVPRNYVQTLSADSGFQRTPESHSDCSLSSAPCASRTPSGGGHPQGRLHWGSEGPMAHKEWYFGRITRSECDQLLGESGKAGEFLVRDSETNVSFSIFECHD